MSEIQAALWITHFLLLSGMSAEAPYLIYRFQKRLLCNLYRRDTYIIAISLWYRQRFLNIIKDFWQAIRCVDEIDFIWLRCVKILMVIVLLETCT